MNGLAIYHRSPDNRRTIGWTLGTNSSGCKRPVNGGKPESVSIEKPEKRVLRATNPNRSFWLQCRAPAGYPSASWR